MSVGNVVWFVGPTDNLTWPSQSHAFLTRQYFYFLPSASFQNLEYVDLGYTLEVGIDYIGDLNFHNPIVYELPNSTFYRIGTNGTNLVLLAFRMSERDTGSGEFMTHSAVIPTDWNLSDLSTFGPGCMMYSKERYEMMVFLPQLAQNHTINFYATNEPFLSRTYKTLAEDDFYDEPFMCSWTNATEIYFFFLWYELSQPLITRYWISPNPAAKMCDVLTMNTDGALIADFFAYSLEGTGRYVIFVGTHNSEIFIEVIELINECNNFANFTFSFVSPTAFDSLTFLPLQSVFDEEHKTIYLSITDTVSGTTTTEVYSLQPPSVVLLRTEIWDFGITNGIDAISVLGPCSGETEYFIFNNFSCGVCDCDSIEGTTTQPNSVGECTDVFNEESGNECICENCTDVYLECRVVESSPVCDCPPPYFSDPPSGVCLVTSTVEYEDAIVINSIDFPWTGVAVQINETENAEKVRFGNIIGEVALIIFTNHYAVPVTVCGNGEELEEGSEGIRSYYKRCSYTNVSNLIPIDFFTQNQTQESFHWMSFVAFRPFDDIDSQLCSGNVCPLFRNILFSTPGPHMVMFDQLLPQTHTVDFFVYFEGVANVTLTNNLNTIFMEQEILGNGGFSLKNITYDTYNSLLITFPTGQLQLLSGVIDTAPQVPEPQYPDPPNNPNYNVSSDTSLTYGHHDGTGDQTVVVEFEDFGGMDWPTTWVVSVSQEVFENRAVETRTYTSQLTDSNNNTATLQLKYFLVSESKVKFSLNVSGEVGLMFAVYPVCWTMHVLLSFDLVFYETHTKPEYAKTTHTFHLQELRVFRIDVIDLATVDGTETNTTHKVSTVNRTLVFQFCFPSFTTLFYDPQIGVFLQVDTTQTTNIFSGDNKNTEDNLLYLLSLTAVVVVIAGLLILASIWFVRHKMRQQTWGELKAATTTSITIAPHQQND
eukprot:CAMPEP_0174265394 /NCGR_PEP_ID=MMETSP0439-20130205/26328_1 /TAXON_ID=0 /ORGANISM="Stereomyxa ramosa, Strain Chinc5" /LENGTH=933 /DNA_ID=CAMNT_0015351831 /DNA_START=1 /DNA_END=2802 /DNA_ORIENTATION=+